MAAEEAPHPEPEVRHGRLDDRVMVRIHEAACVTEPAELASDACEAREIRRRSQSSSTMRPPLFPAGMTWWIAPAASARGTLAIRRGWLLPQLITSCPKETRIPGRQVSD